MSLFGVPTRPFQNSNDKVMLSSWKNWLNHGFSLTKLVCFNRCHFAYHMITLADIITRNHLWVMHDAISLNLEECLDSKWNWSNKRPCIKDINHWKEGL